MKKNNGKILSELILGRSKHGNYQDLPPCLPEYIHNQFPHRQTIRLDSARFDWLDQHDVFDNKTIIEIGANIGYFSLRAVTERNATCIAYEPDEKLASAIELIAEICNVQERVNVRCEPFTLLNPIPVPNVDLILCLNVIHHAGFDFDKDIVKQICDWTPYAINYLTRLTTIAPQMVFQMGYTWGGGSISLCPPGMEWNDWTVDLLRQAGWRVVHIGKTCQNSNSIQRKYYDKNDLSQVTKPKLRTNIHTWAYSSAISMVSHLLPCKVKESIKKLIDIKDTSNIEAQIERFALRPLYICEKI